MARELNEYRICAMCRSGQHAVVNWIAGCWKAVGAEVRFYNSIKVGSNPVKINSTAKKLSHLYTSKPMDGSVDAIIYNYEDKHPAAAFTLSQEKREQHFGRSITHSTDIVVLRRPGDLFASRLCYRFSATMRDQRRRDRFVSEVVPLWCEYVDAWLAGEVTGIWFGELLSNPDYRNHIADLLRLPASDPVGLDYQGTESSFTRRKKHGDPAVKNPFNRTEKIARQYPWLKAVLQMNEITSRSARAEACIMEWA